MGLESLDYLQQEFAKEKIAFFLSEIKEHSGELFTNHIVNISDNYGIKFNMFPFFNPNVMRIHLTVPDNCPFNYKNLKGFSLNLLLYKDSVLN